MSKTTGSGGDGNPDVIETFADHCERVLFDGTTLRVDLSVTRFLEAPSNGKPGKASRAVVSRLVLTPQAALQVYAQIGQVIAAMEKKGLVQRQDKKPATSQ